MVLYICLQRNALILYESSRSIPNFQNREARNCFVFHHHLEQRQCNHSDVMPFASLELYRWFIHACMCVCVWGECNIQSQWTNKCAVTIKIEKKNRYTRSKLSCMKRETWTWYMIAWKLYCIQVEKIFSYQLSTFFWANYCSFYVEFT